MRPEARNWLVQARADMAAAEALSGSGHYSQCAFMCHQAAEKAMRGAIIHVKRHLPPRTHNLIELGQELTLANGEMTNLRLLNPEYLTSRYPDAANGLPADNYDQPRCDSLIEAARRVLEWADSALTGKA